MDIELVAKLISINAYEVYRGTLNGLQSSQKLFKILENPKVGDLVLETSTIYRENYLNKLGYLEQISMEPIYESEDPEEEPPLDKVYYIKTLDGRSFRWHNASFIKVLEDFNRTR